LAEPQDASITIKALRYDRKHILGLGACIWRRAEARWVFDADFFDGMKFSKNDGAIRESKRAASVDQGAQISGNLIGNS
tara:strand:+ start:1636 stop:1872 length:237 start_codon:yes stop_codon:yes gene_type:complete